MVVSSSARKQGGLCFIKNCFYGATVTALSSWFFDDILKILLSYYAFIVYTANTPHIAVHVAHWHLKALV